MQSGYARQNMFILILFLSFSSCAPGQLTRPLFESQPVHESPLTEPEVDRSHPPKFEMRGVWLTTVVNLDWPSSRTLPTEEQKRELTRLLDEIKNAGMNTVFFQVRSESDAMYPSPYEPWSYWLTGEQGRAPVPFYDPLAFAIEEAHKRGLELHAWLNPYRAHRNLASYPQHPSHVAKMNPDWVMSFQNEQQIYSMLNPGLQEVRDFITNVVVDILRRYEVDGIHFDDYFYPYAPPITTEDRNLFEMNPRGFTNIGDWRRDNVHLMIAQVADSIAAIDPMVKYGISPFGIRKNSDAGTRGTEGYHSIYADPLRWLEEGVIDYITPQLYWNTEHPVAPYTPLLRWWSEAASVNNRHLYVGHAPYRLHAPFNWDVSEMELQIELNRTNAHPVQGSVFFRTAQLVENPKGLTDSLRTKWYRRPALTPPMDWKSAEEPSPVEDLLVHRESPDLIRLTWSAVDNTRKFAVYRYPLSTPIEEVLKLENSEFLIAITGETQFSDIPDFPGGNYVYAITAIGRNSEESIPRMIVSGE